MVAADEAAKALGEFKQAFGKEPCDLAKCQELMAQLKLQIFSFQSSGALYDQVKQDPAASKERLLAQEVLELACFLSIRCRDLEGFERHVTHWKPYYYDLGPTKQSETKSPILGLYLLHLLASDRIGEFHTELELIDPDEHEKNQYIRQPVQLERYLMEGNYQKIMEAQKDVPKDYYPYFMERLMETVRQKVGVSMERSCTKMKAEQVTARLMLNSVEELKEFAVRENERKAAEKTDVEMQGDATPSLGRALKEKGQIKWEVKDGFLNFKKENKEQQEVPALELMMNAIGYATDLERIV